MTLTAKDPLRSPRNKSDAAYFELLDSIVSRKIEADLAAGREPVSDYLIEYEAFPDGKAQFLKDLFNTQRYRFKLIAEKKAAPDLDRTASMISGPVYTNQDHPWLGHEDDIAEPLLQLDLEWAGALGGIDLGTGLLQVWSLGGEIEERTIPRASIVQNEITLIPAWAGRISGIDADKWFNCDARETGCAAWTESGHQIIDVASRGLDMHQAINRFLEELIDEDPGYDPQLVRDARKALNFSGSGSADNRSSTVDGWLFGNYQPWNWDADLSSVLLNLESDTVLCFKDEGQGTLFYSGQGETASFYFQWGL